jgi:hypothetical protein
MTLSTPRSVYGIHSFSPYKRSDHTFYGILKVLESSSLSLSGAQVDLYGGSNKYAWASETGQVNAELTLKMGQIEDFMFELFLGKAPTPTSAETTGVVSAVANVKGTSIVAATGILSTITILSSGASLKFGKYTLVATGAAALDVYASTDIDFARGTAGSYSSDTLKVGSLTAISTGATKDLTAFGIEVTGGASATAFVTGDTAEFSVRPVNVKTSIVKIGGAADTFPEFGAIVMAQHRGSDELVELEAFRCKAAGFPIGFDSFKWAIPEVKAKLLYDSTQDAIFQYRYVSPQAI